MQGGCKCDNFCNCRPGLGGNPCDKCNVPVGQGGCKCDNNCNCKTSPTPTPTPTPVPSGGGNVLYQGSGSGTYYYDIRGQSCNGETYAENNGYPSCTSFAPGPNQQTLAQVNSNNVVAIDRNVLGANRAGLCGKKVLVYKDGRQVSAPDGGDFFVWDGCEACVGGGKIDFSVSGIRNVDGNGCNLGVVPGVTYKVVDQQVKTFVW